MAHPEDKLTIGEVADRSGMAPSALRFYEERGLLRSLRTAGNQRRYPRAVLRRLALIRAGQTAGLTLESIAAALAILPDRALPSGDDWLRLSTSWRDDLDRRIDHLQALRDQLTSCIGCGCLSLRQCNLLNANDTAADHGPGAQFLGQDDRRTEDR